MTRNDKWLALILLVVGLIGAWVLWQAPRSPSVRSDANSADLANRQLGRVWVASTNHYQVTTRATMEQTTEVGAIAEALFRSYSEAFGFDDKAVPKGGLRLSLYKDRAQFQSSFGDLAKVGAIYRPPSAISYVDDADPTTAYWLLLAGTLQLNNEVAHLPRGGWLDQGLAYYFSTSNLDDWTLTLGRVDDRNYPADVLRKTPPSGDATKDFADGRLLRLRAVVGGAAVAAANADAAAVSYWSLVHFLRHHEQGKYAPKLRELITSGGKAGDFERLIGPFDVVEKEWYGYVGRLASGEAEQPVIVVD